MHLPPELEAAFADLKQKVDEKHADVTAGITSLRTLVVNHYHDVSTSLRALQRHVDRLNDHVGLSRELPPESRPQPLPEAG